MTLKARGRISLSLLVSALALVAGCNSSNRPPSLGDPISVEQANGTATQLIASGNVLPTSATESFTTSFENQKRLYVHVLRGAAKKAGQLSSDSWWAVDGVQDGPAGQPHIFITFEVDINAALTLSARQESFKLTAKKLEKPPEGQKPSPLTEPDDDDEGNDNEAE